MKNHLFTLSKTNDDVEIDEKKRHPRLFSGRVLINVPISMLVSKCWFYIGNPRAMFVVFYGFTFATRCPRSTLVVSHLGKSK